MMRPPAPRTPLPPSTSISRRYWPASVNVSVWTSLDEGIGVVPLGVPSTSLRQTPAIVAFCAAAAKGLNQIARATIGARNNIASQGAERRDAFNIGLSIAESSSSRDF